ncbi:hypothetical protein HK098_001834 [Nowakowskiella sp. JEL0407]|nr:hypothetical protein HK098_001834 [Nowakowskiella sp. JEL0407]
MRKYPSPMDTVADTVQTARDVGLEAYNDALVHFGYMPKTGFNDLKKSTLIKNLLEDLYVSVEEMDVYIGGMLEDHVVNGHVGPLFASSIKDQFERLRDGDRYYYKNGGFSSKYGFNHIYSAEELDKIENITLMKIFSRECDVTYSQSAFTQINPTPSVSPNNIITPVCPTPSTEVQVANETQGDSDTNLHIG